MKLYAFHKWLLAQTDVVAARHLLDCLTNGSQDNMAWELLEEIHGPEWSCPPGRMGEFLLDTVCKLRERAKEAS